MTSDAEKELLSHLSRSPFYAQRLSGRVPGSIADVPFITKADLVGDQQRHPPYGSNLTRPTIHYTRLHQSSGTTTGQPLRWLDTPESWNWLLDRWDIIYEHIGIKPDDRLLFAFSFGPFLGFWTAFESAVRRGLAVFPAGGMSSAARLRFLFDHQITVVLCTPTYALHLAEIAAKESIKLASSGVRSLIVAGEPGGMILATRLQLENAWGARVFDHYGSTEIGPVAVECHNDSQAMLVVDGYIAEVIDPISTRPVASGETGELVLTNVGRLGSPLARYRTGDVVRAELSPRGLRLVGGILGRMDDMIHIRGNNVYPAAIEAVVRRFPEVHEFRVTVDSTSPLSELAIEVESIANSNDNQIADRLAQAIRDELHFRPTVISVSEGTLPRFEMKAKRFHRKERKVP